MPSKVSDPSARPTVCYMIYSHHATSGGGSFHTLRHHVSAFSSIVQPYVVNVGVGRSASLSTLANYRFFPFARWEIVQFIRVLRHLRAIKPDVIHAYDHRSLLIARVLRLFLGCAVAYTKCGGSNGSSFIPRADAYILFSRENFEHFNRHAAGIEAYLVPQRIHAVDTDSAAVARLRDRLKLDANDRALLRISRVNRYYDRTYRQTLRLINTLREQGHCTKLLFVGSVQDEGFFLDLQQEVKEDPDVHFVTDEDYTIHASRLLPIAEAVVATGRGVMEACSMNLRVYCPTSLGDAPVPLNDQTFPVLFDYNFSERAPVGMPSAAEVWQETPNTRALFDEHFSIDTRLAFYEGFYASFPGRRPKKAGVTNFLYHLMQFFRPRHA